MLSNYICHCSQWMLAGTFQNCIELTSLRENKYSFPRACNNVFTLFYTVDLYVDFLMTKGNVYNLT